MIKKFELGRKKTFIDNLVKNLTNSVNGKLIRLVITFVIKFKSFERILEESDDRVKDYWNLPD